jgi:glycosyltransferase involved in cell wall biosynthesis
LLIFHSNFLHGNQGQHNRLISLTKALKSRGFEVDLFGFEHFSEYSFSTFERDNSEHLIRHAFVYDMYQQASRIDRFVQRVKNKLHRMFVRDVPHLFDWTRPGMREMLTKILHENEYCAVFNFYNYLTPLLDGIPFSGKKIYFMDDCCFIQQQSWEADKRLSTFGYLLNDDLERMQAYDVLFNISYDEKIWFEKLTGRKIHFFPHLIESRHHMLKPIDERKWDVMYIGFHNPYNTEAVQWFMDHVYPLLDKNIRMVFVGSVTDHVNCKRKNIEVIPYAEDLKEIYSNSKISICPMFHGTGMKIKVVEAMSYGLPVVCNERGVDGLPDKTKNGCIVTEDPAEFAHQINLLLTDRAYYDRQAAQIRDYFNTVFDNDRYVVLLVKELTTKKKSI